MNVKLVFSYDGSRFNGSQKQPEKNTVADAFLECFNSMGIDSQFILSGRTDKDVHATGQVANIKLPHYWDNTQRLHNKLNQYLPSSIKLYLVQEVDDLFNARFSAKKRVYRYILSTDNIDPFKQAYITYHDKELNIEIINKAIKKFIGIHDFEYFSKKGSEPVSTVREIFDVKFYQHKGYYIFKFKGSSFLRSQIRLMVQTLLNISDGKKSINDLEDALNKKGTKLKSLAPPNGLYLSKIIY